MLQHVCAWCQAEGIGTPPGPGQTHGICFHHMTLMLAEIMPSANAKAVGKVQKAADQGRSPLGFGQMERELGN